MERNTVGRKTLPVKSQVSEKALKSDERMKRGREARKDMEERGRQKQRVKPR